MCSQKLFPLQIPYLRTRNDAVSHSNSKNSATQLVFYRGFTSKLFVKATIIMDKGRNRSKGYGYVTFSTEEEAQKALADMNGKLLDGRVIFVDNVRPSRRYNTDAPLERQPAQSPEENYEYIAVS